MKTVMILCHAIMLFIYGLMLYAFICLLMNDPEIALVVGGAWLLCGCVAYGVVMGYLQRKYALLILMRRGVVNGFKRGAFGLLPFGIIGLAIALVCCDWGRWGSMTMRIRYDDLIDQIMMDFEHDDATIRCLKKHFGKFADDMTEEEHALAVSGLESDTTLVKP